MQNSGVYWPLLRCIKFIHILKVIAAENPAMVILQFLGPPFLAFETLLLLSPLLVTRASGDRERRLSPKRTLKKTVGQSSVGPK